MPFVLSENCITQLGKLRQHYEKEAGVNLERAAQPYAISLFFGAKDVDSRKNQIKFIEQWVNALRPDVSLASVSDSEEAIQDRVTALKVLMAVTFYINFQIDGTYTFGSSASTLLGRLINQAMGISHTNVIDEETSACCLLAAKRFLDTKGCFESMNARLKDRFTERQWLAFSGFVTHQCCLLDSKYKTEYPITMVMMSAMAKPMELAGNAAGYLVANVLVKTSVFHPFRYALTTMVGSGVFVLIGPTTNVGALMLVPTITGQAIDFLCGASLAWVMGTALKWVGQGVGMGVGIPLDMSKKLLDKTCGLFVSTPEKDSTLTGMVLIDGHAVVNGMDLAEDDFEMVPHEMALKPG